MALWEAEGSIPGLEGHLEEAKLPTSIFTWGVHGQKTLVFLVYGVTKNRLADTFSTAQHSVAHVFSERTFLSLLKSILVIFCGPIWSLSTLVHPASCSGRLTCVPQQYHPCLCLPGGFSQWEAQRMSECGQGAFPGDSSCRVAPAAPGPLRAAIIQLSPFGVLVTAPSPPPEAQGGCGSHLSSPRSANTLLHLQVFHSSLHYTAGATLHMPSWDPGAPLPLQNPKTTSFKKLSLVHLTEYLFLPRTFKPFYSRHWSKFAFLSMLFFGV